MLRDIYDPQDSGVPTKAEVAANIFCVDEADLAPQPGTVGVPLARFEYLDPLGVWLEDTDES